tara:strand:- start:67 stop:420 length:354 start_codon:yes stop_codon:yes gene_type:complete
MPELVLARLCSSFNHNTDTVTRGCPLLYFDDNIPEPNIDPKCPNMKKWYEKIPNPTLDDYKQALEFYKLELKGMTFNDEVTKVFKDKIVFKENRISYLRCAVAKLMSVEAETSNDET